MSVAKLSATNICKRYAGTEALKDVNFEIGQGEILGLIGENGAGKSTLMKILCGIEQHNSGDIILGGKPVQFADPQAAQAEGIAMIPQEVLLVDALTVVENIFLGHEETGRFGGLSKREMRARTAEILTQLNCTEIDPDQTTGNLPKGSQQMVAIARRIMQGGEIFVMDEPTSSLTADETDSLFVLLRKLKKEGKASVFISHRLEEMLEVCDRIVVLRDGINAGDFKNDGTLTKDKLVAAMVGSAVADEFARTVTPQGDVLLETQKLVLNTFQGRRTPEISFEAHAGRVVGITGLAGVGKTELAQVLCGLRPPVSGDLIVRGENIKLASPVDALKQRIGLVSEDRRNEGLVLQLSALSNMTLTTLGRLSNFLKIDRSAEKELGEEMRQRLLMRAEYMDRDANLLSGGNQQKVVIIRQICGDAEILLLDEPTKGIDIGAKAEVYRLIGDLVGEGKSAVLFSSEPREILGVCDIIYVLSPQGFLGPFEQGELDYAKLMALQFGATVSEVPKETVQ